MLIKKLHKWRWNTEPAGVEVRIRACTPGLAVSVLVALAAQFLAEHNGVPAMLMALLIGLSLNFLAEPNSPTGTGRSFTAKSVPRIGVALLGTRISVSMLAEGGDVQSACRAVGVSDATYYNWRRRFGGMARSQLSELRSLEKESARLKKIVAELELDKLILKESLNHLKPRA